jgi:hypothetical protein
VDIPCSLGPPIQRLTGTSIGKCNLWSDIEKNSECATATATVSGLVAYFLGTPTHLLQIRTIANQIIQDAAAAALVPFGLVFNLAIKQHLKSLAYPRCAPAQNPGLSTSGPVGPNVVYNGGNPLNNQNEPVLGKRQVETAPSCPIPPSTKSFYFITPNYTADISVLNAFTNTLKAETNATTLEISSSPSGNLIAYWVQNLTQSQVATYLSSPAVSVSWLRLFSRFLT